MKFVKSNHRATLRNEHLGELIRTSVTYCPDFQGLEKQKLNIDNHYRPTSFNVKLPFFTVFVLTLQSDFAARRCFWFSANDSSIEQFAHPWFTLCVKKHV